MRSKSEEERQMQLNQDKINQIRKCKAILPTENSIIQMLCDDWETMHRIVAEVANKRCESPHIVTPSKNTPTVARPCGECLSCEAKKAKRKSWGKIIEKRGISREILEKVFRVACVLDSPEFHYSNFGAYMSTGCGIPYDYSKSLSQAKKLGLRPCIKCFGNKGKK